MRLICKVMGGIGLVAAITACGSEEPVRATGRPMAETEASVRTDGKNRAPEIERIVLRPTNPRPGERVSVEVTAFDPDGDRVQLSYQWHVDNVWKDGGPTLRVDRVPKGTPIGVRVVATDGQTAGSPGMANVTVGNQLPVLLGIGIEPPGQLTVQSDLQAVPRAMDPDGDKIEYGFTWRVNGRTVEDAGATLPRSEFRRGDEISLAVLASDGSDVSSPIESQPMTVGNAPPKIVSTPGDLEDDGSFLYPVAVEEPDGDPRFRYRLIESPHGMRVDFVNGLVTWQPVEADAGDHRVLIEVDDLSGGIATQAFRLTVAFEPDQPPAARGD